jgi:hypothetical protein
MSDSEIDKLARETAAIALRLMKRIDATYQRAERATRLARQCEMIARTQTAIAISRTKIIKRRATRSR